MEHIWTLEKWTKNPAITRKGRRRGLRLRIDKDVDPEVRRACLEFAKWMRKEFFFPVRVRVYVKNTKRIRAKDGELVLGTLWRPGDYNEEPYARVAAGCYSELCEKQGQDYALAQIRFIMAQVLTHYFQWVNDLPLTSIGEKRQATRYGYYLLDEYALQSKRGVNNPYTYNKIWSPGKKLYEKLVK